MLIKTLFPSKKIGITIVMAALSVLATGCGITLEKPSSSIPIPPPTALLNPSPTISNVSPSFVIAGELPEPLVVTGTGFMKSSSVTFNGGVPNSITYSSPNQISIGLSAVELSTAGNYTLAITNPTPGEGTAQITYAVWQPLQDKKTGMSLAVPLLDNYSATLAVTMTSNTTATVIPTFTLPGSDTSVSGFSLSIEDPNTQHVGLLQWFEKNIDINGTLIQADAYKQQTLLDGSQAIVPSSGSTNAFYAAGGLGALNALYKETNTGVIVSAFPSNEPTLYEAGLLHSTDSQMQLELEVLSTVHF